MCGFSLTHDHKNSLEKDRSLELEIEDPLERDEQELRMVLLLLVQVKEEMEEEVEVVGEGGDGDILFDAGTLGVLGACEITSLSSTWLLISSKERFLDLHLLMQQPIFWI